MIVFLEGSGSFVPSRDSPKKTRKSPTLLGFLDVEEVYALPVSAWKIVRASSFTAIELETVRKRITLDKKEPRWDSKLFVWVV